MSVYREDVIVAENEPLERVMAGHHEFGLVSLEAGIVRQKNQTVHPDPLPEERSHAQVCGPKTKGTRRFFVRHSDWVIPPPQ